MRTPSEVDLRLLRTLVVVAEEGSLSRAANRVGRSQSAVSLQMQRLENACGGPLLYRRKGGGVELTAAGEELLSRARELLALNDKLIATLSPNRSQTSLRIGAWSEYADQHLRGPIAEFTRGRPDTSVEVASGLSCQLLPLFLENKLDLMICDGGMAPPGWPASILWTARLRWITSVQESPHRIDPLPLSLGPAECPWRPGWVHACLWREAAVHALEKAGRPYRYSPSLTSVAGFDANVLAGKAVTVSTLPQLPHQLRHVTLDEGLPELPEFPVALLVARQPRHHDTKALADFLARSFRGNATLKSIGPQAAEFG